MAALNSSTTGRLYPSQRVHVGIWYILGPETTLPYYNFGVCTMMVLGPFGSCLVPFPDSPGS